MALGVGATYWSEAISRNQVPSGNAIAMYVLYSSTHHNNNNLLQHSQMTIIVHYKN